MRASCQPEPQAKHPATAVGPNAQPDGPRVWLRAGFLPAPGATSWRPSTVVGGGLLLVLAGSAAFVLLARGAARAVLREPYLVTARAKGLPELRVALRHALPNAILPVLTLLGVRVGHVFGGAVGGVIVVERVFSIPGLGLLAFEAVRARDYPVLQATFLLGSAAVLLASLAAELAYRWLVPEPPHAR